MMSAAFADYGKKRVLVTGGAGFIGQNLVARLLGAGAEVTVFDYAISRDLDALAGENPGTLHLRQGDIRDEAKVRAIVEELPNREAITMARMTLDRMFNRKADS